MNDVKLGTLVAQGTKAERDAIHVAIYPVVAAMEMWPGDHVGLMPDGRASIMAETKTGIVDPFLTQRVEPGEMFYLVLYQRTVTGMRHHWEHPEFPAEAQIGPPDHASMTRPEQMKVEARYWITGWALSKRKTYEEMMACAKEYHEKGTMVEEWGDTDVPDEFWKHYKVLTGVQHSGSFFACCPN